MQEFAWEKYSIKYFWYKMCIYKLHKIKHLFKEEIQHEDKHYGYQEKVCEDLKVQSVRTAVVTDVCSLTSDCLMDTNNRYGKKKITLKKKNKPMKF